MPVTIIKCSTLPLVQAEVDKLWQTVRGERNFPEEEVAIRCVTEKEIQELNIRYQRKDTPTNVLTFSYEKGEPASPVGGHDIALCLTVAQREARERSRSSRDYVALLLVHAFLHVTGMDHERSAQEAKTTQELEVVILNKAGFASGSLDNS